MTARVVLYVRQGCHLCEDARDVVTRVCEAVAQDHTEVDIDTDPELTARYGDEIPVATVDGEVVGFWRIDPERLRSALS